MIVIEHRRMNLDRANEIRLARVAIMAPLREGGQSAREVALKAAEVLFENDEALASMPVGLFFDRLYRLPKTRWQRFLASARTSEYKAMEMLTPRQRGILVGCLRAYGRSEP